MFGEHGKTTHFFFNNPTLKWAPLEAFQSRDEDELLKVNVVNYQSAAAGIRYAH